MNVNISFDSIRGVLISRIYGWCICMVIVLLDVEKLFFHNCKQFFMAWRRTLSTKRSFSVFAGSSLFSLTTKFCLFSIGSHKLLLISSGLLNERFHNENNNICQGFRFIEKETHASRNIINTLSCFQKVF